MLKLAMIFESDSRYCSRYLRRATVVAAPLLLLGRAAEVRRDTAMLYTTTLEDLENTSNAERFFPLRRQKSIHVNSPRTKTTNK